jgi:hypothetical protein
MSENLRDTILYLIQRYSFNPPLFVKIIFLLFALFFFGVIIYFLKKTSWFEKIFLQDFIELATVSSFGIVKSREAFRKIMERLKTQNEDEAKLAIIEADDLLNENLNRIGYKKEESLGEKLDETTPDIIPNLEEVNEAHKVRNNIIHDPAYRLDLEEAGKILSVYEKAIQNLETI